MIRLGQNARGGFTLIELGVALSILAIVALVSAPAMGRYIQDYRLEGAACNLIGDLHLCRHRAVAEGNNYTLTLNPTDNTYTILDDDNNNGQADQGEQLLGPIEVPYGLDLKNGPSLPFDHDQITMYPNGTASATGIITIQNAKGRERLLYVLSSTGFAKKLWEYQGTLEGM